MMGVQMVKTVLHRLPQFVKLQRHHSNLFFRVWEEK